MLDLELLAGRQIQPLIAHRFPLAEARQAHEMLEAGGVTGKIVLIGGVDTVETSLSPQNSEQRPATAAAS